MVFGLLALLVPSGTFHLCVCALPLPGKDGARGHELFSIIGVPLPRPRGSVLVGVLALGSKLDAFGVFHPSHSSAQVLIA